MVRQSQRVVRRLLPLSSAKKPAIFTDIQQFRAPVLVISCATSVYGGARLGRTGRCPFYATDRGRRSCPEGCATRIAADRLDGHHESWRFFVELGRRLSSRRVPRAHHMVWCTPNPSAPCVFQQARQLSWTVPERAEPVKFLIRDREVAVARERASQKRLDNLWTILCRTARNTRFSSELPARRTRESKHLRYAVNRRVVGSSPT